MISHQYCFIFNINITVLASSVECFRGWIVQLPLWCKIGKKCVLMKAIKWYASVILAVSMQYHSQCCLDPFYSLSPAIQLFYEIKIWSFSSRLIALCETIQYSTKQKTFYNLTTSYKVNVMEQTFTWSKRTPSTRMCIHCTCICIWIYF